MPNDYPTPKDFFTAAWAALAAVGVGKRKADQYRDWLARVTVRGREIPRDLGEYLIGIARAAEGAAREQTKASKGG